MRRLIDVRAVLAAIDHAAEATAKIADDLDITRPTDRDILCQGVEARLSAIAQIRREVCRAAGVQVDSGRAGSALAAVYGRAMRRTGP